MRPSQRPMPASGANSVGVMSYIPHCSATQHWLRLAPKMTTETIFGVGVAQSDDDAIARARAEAAKTLSVELREDISDTQTLSTIQSGAVNHEAWTEHIARVASSSVERRVEHCQGSDKCRDDAGAVHVLVACARRSALERELIAAGRTIGRAARGRVGALLGVPGTDSAGYVTMLGEYALRVVRDSLSDVQSTAGEGLEIVASPPWEPAALQEAARTANATHLIRIEYMSLDANRVHVSVYLQDVATDRHVNGTDVGFDTEFEPAQLALLTVKGPLLPQKEAQDLINASGTFEVPLRISKTDLREGEAVALTVTLPREGFVYVYDIYEDGRAALLLPNPFAATNHFASGATVELPDDGWNRAGLKLQACPFKRQKVTREYVKVILSPVQLDLPGTQVVGAEFTTLVPESSTRSISAVQRRLEELKRAGVPIGTAEMPYFIRAAAHPIASCQTSD